MRHVIGYPLLLVGLAMLGFAGWVLFQAMGRDGALGAATGLFWFQTDPDSLQLLQPAIERHVSVWLYSDIVQPLLEAPLAGSLAVIAGLALVVTLPGWMLSRTPRASR